MNKINFINGQAPALNANNLNLIQTNVENAINDAIDDATATASADATSKVNSMTTTLRSEISTAQSNAVGTAQNYTNDAINYKLRYGTSLPSSADNGIIFILYS